MAVFSERLFYAHRVTIYVGEFRAANFRSNWCFAAYQPNENPRVE